MLIPHEKFLDFLAEEARQYPNFRLVMGANVQRLCATCQVVSPPSAFGACTWNIEDSSICPCGASLAKQFHADRNTTFVCHRDRSV
jgi:hypothetical protein